MIVELARESDGKTPVQLGRIAQITGLSENYLGQLTISLKNRELLIGVSGKKGGYLLAKPAEKITVGDVITAVIGKINIAECSENPHVCLNSCFCETRIVWVVLNDTIKKVLGDFTIADLINRDGMSKIREKYSDIPMIDSDLNLEAIGLGSEQGCPVYPSSRVPRLP
jgi:Rrf2 family transcriptional regulator, cysteine metabolism repressor